MPQVSANHVLQFDPFQVSPDPFIRVQLWSTPGQLLQPEPLGRPLGQVRLDRPATVDRRTVPNHQQLAGYLSEQLFQEPDDVNPLVRVDSGKGQDRTLRGKAPVECAIDGWS